MDLKLARIYNNILRKCKYRKKMRDNNKNAECLNYKMF